MTNYQQNLHIHSSEKKFFIFIIRIKCIMMLDTLIESYVVSFSEFPYPVGQLLNIFDYFCTQFQFWLGHFNSVDWLTKEFNHLIAKVGNFFCNSSIFRHHPFQLILQTDFQVWNHQLPELPVLQFESDDFLLLLYQFEGFFSPLTFFPFEVLVQFIDNLDHQSSYFFRVLDDQGCQDQFLSVFFQGQDFFMKLDDFFRCPLATVILFLIECLVFLKFGIEVINLIILFVNRLHI